MTCPHCGKEIAEDSIFCEYCGKKLKQVKAKKKSYWLLWTVLCLILCAGVVAVAIYATKQKDNKEASAEVCLEAAAPSIVAEHVFIGDLFYNLYDDKTAEVVKDDNYNNTLYGELTIPSTIKYEVEEYSVTSIGDNAFYGCSSLKSITIPNSVISIGKGAFYGCSSLTSVTIPNSVTSIGRCAFSDCESLTSVTIPNSVTSIGGLAFYGCSSLKSITIPNSVTDIGVGAFYGCSSLKSVTIPNSVTNIEGSAFYGCSSLTSVTIPNSVKNIAADAFEGCENLKIIYEE